MFQLVFNIVYRLYQFVANGVLLKNDSFIHSLKHKFNQSINQSVRILENKIWVKLELLDV